MAFVRDRISKLTYNLLTICTDRILRANNKIEAGNVVEMQYTNYHELVQEYKACESPDYITYVCRSLSFDFSYAQEADYL